MEGSGSGLFLSILHLSTDNVEIQVKFKYYSQLSGRDLYPRFYKYEVGF